MYFVGSTIYIALICYAFQTNSLNNPVHPEQPSSLTHFPLIFLSITFNWLNLVQELLTYVAFDSFHSILILSPITFPSSHSIHFTRMHFANVY